VALAYLSAPLGEALATVYTLLGKEIVAAKFSHAADKLIRLSSATRLLLHS
jgi:hypothetical protein